MTIGHQPVHIIQSVLADVHRDAERSPKGSNAAIAADRTKWSRFQNSDFQQSVQSGIDDTVQLLAILSDTTWANGIAPVAAPVLTPSPLPDTGSVSSTSSSSSSTSVSPAAPLIESMK